MYLAIAVARAASIVIDKSVEQSNIISLVVEIVFGAILVL
jgi:intracellular septation protein A